MKRTYQGYSGSGPPNPNLPAPPSIAYPPLPSGPPPPQPTPASSGQPNPAAVSNNPQYQPQQTSSNSVPPPSTSQPYQYNPQFSATAAAPYAQYPGYQHQQQVNQGYVAPIGPVPPPMGTYGYNPQLSSNPHQQQQQSQPQPQQPQQPQHPAFPNYGYGGPAGPQQPPKVGQPYQPYPHQPNQLPANPSGQHPSLTSYPPSANSNQAPQGNVAYHPQTPQYSNPPNPNIPPNPYTGYPAGQPNANALQGSPGSVAPPPYKRPRYEAGTGGGTYATQNTQQPNTYQPNQPPNHNAPPPALPPLRNQNSISHSTPTPLRMGANTNNNRGGFGGGRGPRPSGGPFGNNSPIRLNLGNGGTFDGNGAPQFDSSHPHPPPHVSHPLPPHHQSQHGPLPGQHYPPAGPNFNNNNTNSNANTNVHEPHYPIHSSSNQGRNFHPSTTTDHSHSNVNTSHHGPNEGMRASSGNFGHSDLGGYSSQPPSTSSDNYAFHDSGRSGPAGAGGRAGRGGFRGGGTGGGGGRMSRDRVSDYGGDNHGGNRGGRGVSNNSYGPGNRGDRHGSAPRGRSIGVNSPNNRYDDHSSNYGGGNSRVTQNHDRMSGPSNRARSISNLPASGAPNKSNHSDRRNGGGGRFSNIPSSGDRTGRGARRNGRDSKYDDHKHAGRGPRGHTGPGPNNAGPDRADRDRPGPSSSSRVKNGWGAQFKEFNDREKEKEKKEEVAPTKRTLTDFRINALDIPDLTWSWLAENSETLHHVGPSAIASSLDEIQLKIPLVPSKESQLTISGKTGKHGREEDEAQDGSSANLEVSPSNLMSTDPVTSSTATITAGTKKVKSDATVELAKKIDEEAASAVKGLNLTVDDQGSEQEESIVGDEVKNQLLVSKDAPLNTSHVDVSVSSVEKSANVTSPVHTSQAGDGQLDTSSKPNEVSTDDATPRPTVPDGQTALQSRERERVHSYSKPTIPAGRENSRLRLYFSAPTNVTTEPPPSLLANTSLPNKPSTSLVGHTGKRKLSVSALSAMSVDTRIGGGRGSSPALPFSPVKGLAKGSKAAKVDPDSTGHTNQANPSATGHTTGSEKQGEVSLEDALDVETANVKVAPGNHQVTSDTNATVSNNNQQVTDSQKPELGLEVEVDENEKTTPKNTAQGADVKTEEEEYDEDQDADGDYEEEDDYEGPPMPEPQPDRLSISYARNTRRMVIDSDVVETIKVYRAEHKIEVLVRLIPAIIRGGKYDGEIDEYRVCKGVLVEALDQEIDDYVIIDRAVLEATCNAEESKSKSAKVKAGVTQGAEKSPIDADHDEETLAGDDYEVVHDPLLPPLHKLFLSSLQQPSTSGGEGQVSQDASHNSLAPDLKITSGFKQDTILIVAKLDTTNPLTEAKWVRTGDVDSWISQMTGRIFKPEDKTECGWRRKITVVDPDPPPTIQHLLDTWLTTSTVGTIDTRQRFIDRHVSKNVDVIIEILLRVVRSGNVANAHHHPNPMPLIVQQAATLHAPYPEQQTQVSLAVLGLYRLSIETAIEAGVPIDKVVKKATDIVRSLPYRLAFSALDGIYKDETPS